MTEPRYPATPVINTRGDGIESSESPAFMHHGPLRLHQAADSSMEQLATRLTRWCKYSSRRSARWPSFKLATYSASIPANGPSRISSLWPGIKLCEVRIDSARSRNPYPSSPRSLDRGLAVGFSPKRTRPIIPPAGHESCCGRQINWSKEIPWEQCRKNHTPLPADRHQLALADRRAQSNPPPPEVAARVEKEARRRGIRIRCFGHSTIFLLVRRAHGIKTKLPHPDEFPAIIRFCDAPL